MGHRYAASLRTTLRRMAAAYGYTLATATSLTMMLSVHGRPHEGDLFLFVAGGTAAFALIESVMLLLGHSGGRQESERALPFAGALNMASAAAALGAATGVAHGVGSRVAWLLVPMASTAVFLLVVALQVTIVDLLRR